MFNQKFNARGLKDYLNEKYENKKTGKKFTDQDVESYLRRGFLPKYLGGNVIIKKENKEENSKFYKNRPIYIIKEESFNFKRKKRNGSD